MRSVWWTDRNSNLKEGGWIELQDVDVHHYSEDDSINPGNQVYDAHENIIEACERTGRSVRAGRHLKAWVEEAGFTNVHHEVFRIPFGPWPKDERMVSSAAWPGVRILTD